MHIQHMADIVVQVQRIVEQMAIIAPDHYHHYMWESIRKLTEQFFL